MSKTMVGLLACLSLVMFSSGSAVASITLTPGQNLASGPQTSQAAINAILANFFGLVQPELYKADVAPFEEFGVAADSYDTAFLDTHPSGAKVSYTGGDVIDGSYLLVGGVGGRPSGLANWYLFDIAHWNGLDEIVLSGFWPSAGAMSHIRIYGTLSAVPEPTSIGLFLMGIGCVTGGSLIRRRR